MVFNKAFYKLMTIFLYVVHFYYAFGHPMCDSVLWVSNHFIKII